jgi:hypothetical protein
MSKASLNNMSAHPEIGQKSAAQLTFNGVAESRLVQAVPEPLDTSFPSIGEIGADLSRSSGQQDGEGE